MSETPKQEYIRLLMDLDGYDMAEVSWGQQKTIMKQSKKLRKQRKKLTHQEGLVIDGLEIMEAIQQGELASGASTVTPLIDKMRKWREAAAGKPSIPNNNADAGEVS